jgi:anti-sigma regulatory factor (Ser/Thr protein kinase)
MRGFFIQNKRILFILITQIALIFALWQTNVFLSEFKSEEEAKIEILGAAYKKLIEAGPNIDLQLPQKILQENKNIPLIVIDQDNRLIYYRNIFKKDKEKLTHKDSIKILNKANKFSKTIPPIILDLGNGQTQYIYYGPSSLYSRLFYYPLILIGIFLLFFVTIYMYYRTGKISDENRLWSGIARETAHQIGTPLSSLMGWIEIMKTQNNSDFPVEELEKDVQRLNTISQRFSKIGSQPELKNENIVEVSRNIAHYLQDRTSKHLKIKLDAEKEITAPINRQLYEWVLENLIKNAVDAMEGKGEIIVQLKQDKNHVIIDVTDQGKGLHKNMFKEIFLPGFTTKKRGWGLGLSLAKRIIEQYHNGKIFVLQSKLGKGTTIRIIIPLTQ